MKIILRKTMRRLVVNFFLNEIRRIIIKGMHVGMMTKCMAMM
jgi:hypothetical protein